MYRFLCDFSLIISALLRGKTDTDGLVQLACREAEQYDPRILPYLDQTRSADTAPLDLDEGLSLEQGKLGAIGYTLKALKKPDVIAVDIR